MTRTPSPLTRAWPAAIRRRLPRGLRWRLTAWVAGVLVISAAAVFAVVYRQTGAQLQGQIDVEVRSDATQLAQALRTFAGHTPGAMAAAARSYIAAQGYAAGSALFFAALPGQLTISNHPEVFGERGFEAGESTTEQAQERRLGNQLLTTRPGYSTHHLPDAGAVRVYAVRVTAGSANALVGVGEPLELVERAQHSVARAFLLAGAIVLAIALLASYLAGAHVSAPLRRMAAVAARVDSGELDPRMDRFPGRADEVQVLAESFNHMLDRLQEAFAGQREFIADASHELRTPLTVIRGQLEVLAATPEPSPEEVRRVEALVGEEVSRTSRLVDDLLLLAQAERADFLRVEAVELPGFVHDLWDGLARTAERRFELGPLPIGRLRADPDRLAQALRNLARNAIEHTASGTGLVRLDVEPAGSGSLRFVVTDDGPGIPFAERERVFERFHRTDRSRARVHGGTGLGLAIVRAIALAHGGSVRARERPGASGALIELVLPGFEPAAGGDGRTSRRYPPPR